MARIGVLYRGLCDGLAALPDFRVYRNYPLEAEPPFAIVSLPDSFTDYVQAFQCGQSRWRISVTFGVNAVESVSAQDDIFDLIDSRSDAISKVREVLGSSLLTMDGSRFGGIGIGDGAYYSAQVTVTVLAD